MDFYNRYLRPKINETYNSAIVFLDHPSGIVQKRLFYIEFNDGKNGYYYDDNDYLANIYNNVRKNGFQINNTENLFLEKTNNLIKNVQPATSYYSYIKVINDYQNPQLNNNIMILKFGYKIKTIIENFLLHNNTYYNNIFLVKIKLTHYFPNYDDCSFIDKNMHVVDNSLPDINTYLNFKKININTIIRKEKLEKIQQNIDDIDEYLIE